MLTTPCIDDEENRLLASARDYGRVVPAKSIIYSKIHPNRCSRYDVVEPQTSSQPFICNSFRTRLCLRVIRTKVYAVISRYISYKFHFNPFNGYGVIELQTSLQTFVFIIVEGSISRIGEFREKHCIPSSKLILCDCVVCVGILSGIQWTSCPRENPTLILCAKSRLPCESILYAWFFYLFKPLLFLKFIVYLTILLCIWHYYYLYTHLLIYIFCRYWLEFLGAPICLILLDKVYLPTLFCD